LLKYLQIYKPLSAAVTGIFNKAEIINGHLNLWYHQPQFSGPRCCYLLYICN